MHLAPRLTATTALLLAALATALSTPALAGGGEAACCDARMPLFPLQSKALPGFDPETGKDLRNYPPHRLADLQHMKLEIMIPDMNSPKFTATQTLKLQAISKPLDTLTLDARGLTISSVVLEGHETRFTHEGRTLTITFAPPLAADETKDLITEYSVNDPALGLIWTPESPAWPGRAAQLHTQGQPETNSFWFPCRDFPNDRMTTEVSVTVPAGYTASSNGYLAEQRRDILVVESATGAKRMKPYDTFHWVQDKPHVAYLVTLVVGKFDIVDVGTPQLSMPVYVTQGQGKNVQATFARTRDMVDFFNKITGQTYPWARYAQLCVHNFGAGGMENTSATTLYESCVIQPDALLDHDLDGLISHELAHQWFGDLATCNSWEHIWLNEGFATYATCLWFEHRDGRTRYESEILDQFDNLGANDHADAPRAIAMVSKEYAHPWEVFRKPANPYGKGSSVLHMLRTSLGDANFFEGLKLYMERHKYQTVETIDFRTALEEVSGRSLEHFFAQWVMRPGTPQVTVTPTWDETAKVLRLTIEQTQNIDGDNPAFEFNLPVLLGLRDSSKNATASHTIAVNAQTVTHEIKLDAEPTFVAIDPNLSVLAKWTIKQGADRWLQQLAQGPTLSSKVQACRGMGASTAGELTGAEAEALRRLALDRSQPDRLRQEAVRALASRGAQRDVRALATTAVDSWQVRVTTSEALAQISQRDELKNNSSVRESISQFLIERARKDKSTRVRASALKALAQVNGENAADALFAALSVESQSDTIRQTAIDALATLAPPGALLKVVPYTMPGNDTRTRPTAIAAVAKLASQDKELAHRTLTALLNDRELRTQRAAGEALATLKDPRTIDHIEKLAASPKSDEHLAMYKDWLTRLKESDSKEAPPGN